MRVLLIIAYFSYLFAAKDTVKSSMNEYVVWRNENEVLVLKSIFKSFDVLIDSNPKENEQIFVYNTKTKKTRRLFNHDNSKRSKFVISYDGSDILWYNYTDNEISLYKELKLLWKRSNPPFLAEHWNHGVRLTNSSLFYVNDNNHVCRYDLETGKVYLISISGTLITPLHCFNRSLLEDIILQSNDKMELYIILPFWNLPIKIFQNLGETSPTFVNKIGDLLFFIRVNKGTARQNSELVSYNIKTGEHRQYKTPAKYDPYIVTRDYQVFSFSQDSYYYNRVDANKKSFVIYKIFTQDGKELKNKKFEFEGSLYPFLTISQNGKNIVIWNFNGIIAVMKLKK